MGRYYLCVLTYTHYNLDGFAPLTEIDQLMQDERMDVFGLVEGNQEDEGELGERRLFEDGVEPQDFRGLLMALRDEEGLVEEVNKVTKGEQPSSSSQHNDSPRVGLA